jgi:NADH-quinone oxidoreductase subunit C
MQIKVNDLYSLIPNDWIQSLVTFNNIENGFRLQIKSNDLKNVLFFFKNSSFFRFKVLTDIVCVDNLNSKFRFELIYCLRSVENNQTVYIHTSLSSDEPVSSVSDIFPSANWLEREIWDMYGVFFSDHPDLRRILTDYGFDGHPLRKDFPLTGYVELRYDDEIKKILIEPVSLTQEFRYFDFTSPWESQRN